MREAAVTVVAAGLGDGELEEAVAAGAVVTGLDVGLACEQPPSINAHSNRIRPTVINIRFMIASFVCTY